MKLLNKSLYIILIFTFGIVFSSKAQIGGSNTDIESYSFAEETGPATITNNMALHKVDIEVAYGTNLSQLVASFTLSSGASANISGTNQVSGTTVNDFSSGTLTYTVTNGTSSQDWDVNVTVASASSEKEITNFDLPNQIGNENINTFQHTVDVTVAQGTNVADLVADFTLSNYASATVNSVNQVSNSTHNDFTNPVVYTVEAQDSSTQDWTITVTISTQANTETEITDYSFAEQTGPANITSNISQHSVDIEVAYGTNLSQLVASFTLSTGAYAEISGVSQVSGTTVNDFSSGTLVYTVTAEDSSTTQDWDINVTVAQNTETDILSYSFTEQTGPATIDTNNHTVAIEVAYGTNISQLVASFTLSGGALADISGTNQVSGTTANDFSSTVVYTITADDGTTVQDWDINVTVAPASSEKNILDFNLPNQANNEVIDNNLHTVDITLGQGANTTDLVADFILSNYATATISGVNQISGTTHNDFSNPVIYTIEAQDGSTQDWTINVTVLSQANTEADIINYSFAEQTGTATINSNTNTIDIEINDTASLNDLIATFSLSSGASAEISGITQVSGNTANDFSSGSLVYTITAEDGTTTENWTVNVTKEVVANIIDDYNNTINIYPNPAQDFIKIRNLNIDINTIQILDITGKIVRQINNQDIFSDAKIDISELKSGVYFVKLVNQNSYQVKQIIKK